MNAFKTAKSITLSKIEELVDFSLYEKSDEGWDKFIIDLKDLFSQRDEETKKAIKSAGGYVAIMDVADLYFESEICTTAVFTKKFLQLCEKAAENVRFDSTGYRYKIRERFSHEWDRFAFPSDFIAAYNLVLSNRGIL